MNMNFKRKLPIPKVIKEEYPLTEKMAKIKEKRDAEIKAVKYVPGHLNLRNSALPLQMLIFQKDRFKVLIL